MGAAVAQVRGGETPPLQADTTKFQPICTDSYFDGILKLGLIPSIDRRVLLKSGTVIVVDMDLN